jgi:hypothetical protein
MLGLQETVEFREWPKIPRGQMESITITEKIDGTNACIVIEDEKIISIQSRKQRISPAALSEEKGTDNMGFAAWVMENAEDLISLGDGYHYGEWAGPGIQKNPHLLEEKKFFLFNTLRWGEHNKLTPACCSVVKVLYEGEFDRDIIDKTMGFLQVTREEGSTPEGVVVYFHKTRRYEKHTYKTQGGKWNVSTD